MYSAEKKDLKGQKTSIDFDLPSIGYICRVALARASPTTFLATHVITVSSSSSNPRLSVSGLTDSILRTVP